MNKVWSLLSVGAGLVAGVVTLGGVAGCAVGSDPSGEETTGTIAPGGPSDPSSQEAADTNQNADGKDNVVKQKTSEFNQAPQVIPGKPNRNGPIAPDPYFHVPAPEPSEMNP